MYGEVFPEYLHEPTVSGHNRGEALSVRCDGVGALSDDYRPKHADVPRPRRAAPVDVQTWVTVAHSSLTSLSISHARQTATEPSSLGVVSHLRALWLWPSRMKKFRITGMLTTACRMQFMKHVFPTLFSPRSPNDRPELGSTAFAYCFSAAMSFALIHERSISQLLVRVAAEAR